jgi:hypothetical protein
MTPNERDIITVLEWLIPATTKQPTDRIAATMQRLLAQLPKPADVVDTRPDGERRKEFLEKQKQPATWTPPPPEKPDSERRAEFLEKMKQPLAKRVM